jgi:hypothetical protein
MSSPQNAPVDAPSQAQETVTLREQQGRKDSAHNLDNTHLDTVTLSSKDTQISELDSALHSHQPSTSTPAATTATQPSPLAASSTSPDALQPQPPNPIENDNENENENFCYCLRPSSGTMIGCDNPSCEREWFHLSCTEFKYKPLPSATQSWYCIPCRGWQAELEPGEPGESDDCWRCPKCSEEVVHDDSWLSGRVSKEPKGCEGCGLRKGERWEPRNMRY